MFMHMNIYMHICTHTSIHTYAHTHTHIHMCTHTHTHTHTHTPTQALCRLVDRVTVKGSDKPMFLYTYDVPFGTRTHREGPEASASDANSDSDRAFSAEIISSKDTPLEEFYR